MKRILVLSVSASIALGFLAGCGTVSSAPLTLDNYRTLIQAKTRDLVSTNSSALNASSAYYGSSTVNPGNYQQYTALWSALTTHILQYRIAAQDSRDAFPGYVALLARFCVLMIRPGNAAFSVALQPGLGGIGLDPSYGYGNIGSSGVGYGASSILPMQYFGSQDSFYSQFLNGSWN